MARRRRRIKTVANASRDLISELPVEVKDRILESLPTQDAARTALLSRHWNHVWLHHGRLAFDGKFLQSVKQKYDPSPSPDQYEFDRWCLFLSRNGVEEFNLYLYYEEYKLPFCLLSCRTIKKLIVQGPFIDLPVNDCGIFSNVTSLALLSVVFNRSVNGIASSISIPKLEKLALHYCGGINKFEICPTQLEILSVIDPIDDDFDSRWLAPHLKARLFGCVALRCR
nr:F-box/FBD/LRR-repeat protein At1g13570-like [Ipomoea batatas]